MNQFSTFKQKLVEYLTARLINSKILLTEDFPASFRQVPPRAPHITVGFDSIELPSSSADIARFTLRFDILCPVCGSVSCCSVFERLCDALVSAGNPFGICRIACGQVAYDRALSALIITATASASGFLLPDTSTGGSSQPANT